MWLSLFFWLHKRSFCYNFELIYEFHELPLPLFLFHSLAHLSELWRFLHILELVSCVLAFKLFLWSPFVVVFYFLSPSNEDTLLVVDWFMCVNSTTTNSEVMVKNKVFCHFISWLLCIRTETWQENRIEVTSLQLW